MHPAKTIAKTQPSSVNLESLAHGGIPEITGTDVAAALSFAGVGRDAYLVGMAKYGFDEQARLELFVRMAERCGSDEVASVLIGEVVDDLVCKKCQGHGQILYKKRYRECKSCGGEGRKRLSDRARAKKAGISPTTWHRRIKKKYSDLAQLLIDAESDCLRALIKQFSVA